MKCEKCGFEWMSGDACTECFPPTAMNFYFPFPEDLKPAVQNRIRWVKIFLWYEVGIGNIFFRIVGDRLTAMRSRNVT